MLRCDTRKGTVDAAEITGPVGAPSAAPAANAGPEVDSDVAVLEFE